MKANELLELKGLEFIKSVLEKAPSRDVLLVVDYDLVDNHLYTTEDLRKSYSSQDCKWSDSLFSTRNGYRTTIKVSDLEELV